MEIGPPRRAARPASQLIGPAGARPETVPSDRPFFVCGAAGSGTGTVTFLYILAEAI